MFCLFLAFCYYYQYFRYLSHVYDTCIYIIYAVCISLKIDGYNVDHQTQIDFFEIILIISHDEWCVFLLEFLQAIIYEGQDKNPEMCRVLLTHEVMCRYVAKERIRQSIPSSLTIEPTILVGKLWELRKNGLACWFFNGLKKPSFSLFF
jgi:Transcription factor COE1 DNA-binding domain